jgi:hypothetical protein
VLAQAQQDAGAAQGHAPGVVIDADQLVLGASGRGTQYGVPEQGAVAVLGDRQFECDLLGHRVNAGRLNGRSVAGAARGNYYSRITLAVACHCWRMPGRPQANAVGHVGMGDDGFG